MKTLQKTTLALAIASAPFFANAELVAMDDAVMGQTTGQAGVTIEINIDAVGISVGEIEYTDEGSVLLQNLTIKNVTNMVQTVDVDANGNLLLGVTGVDGIQIALGDDGTGAFSAVALKSVGGATTELVNNLNMTMSQGPSTTTILNLQETSGNAAAIAALPTSAQSGSVAILANSSIEITDMNVGMFGYTRAQADARADSTAYGGNGDNVVDAGLEQGTSDALATGSAVQIGGLKFYGAGGPGTKANMSQTIWAKGGAAAQGGGVYIQMGEIQGSLDIASIGIGGASIGRVKVSDISMAGVTQRIYGHP